MTVENKPVNHAFASDNAKILQLMIHSLYSNKEIFLRELVSNAFCFKQKTAYEIS